MKIQLLQWRPAKRQKILQEKKTLGHILLIQRSALRAEQTSFSSIKTFTVACSGALQNWAGEELGP